MSSEHFEFTFSYDGAVLARFDLGAGDYCLGSDPDCEIAIDLEGIAPRHALLHINGDVRLECLAQEIGAYVADRRLDGCGKLPPGAGARFGTCPGVLELLPRSTDGEAEKPLDLTDASAAHEQARDEWQRTEAALREEVAALKTEARLRDAHQANATAKLRMLEERAEAERREREASGRREEAARAETARLGAELQQSRDEQACKVQEQATAGMAPLKQELDDLWREYTEQTEAREGEARQWQETERALREELAALENRTRQALTAQGDAAARLTAQKQDAERLRVEWEEMRTQRNEARAFAETAYAESAQLQGDLKALREERDRLSRNAVNPVVASQENAQLLEHANEVLMQKLTAAAASAKEVAALKKQLKQREEALADALVRRQTAEAQTNQLARQLAREQDGQAVPAPVPPAPTGVVQRRVILAFCAAAALVTIVALASGMRSRSARALAAEAKLDKARGAAEQTFQEAQKCLEQRRLDDALLQIGYALALRPESALYHSTRGNVLESLLEMRGAMAEYERALEIEPHLNSARDNLELCRGIAATRHGTSSLESLYALHKLMLDQHRWPEALRMAQRIPEDRQLLHQTWAAYLSAHEMPGRITVQEDGTFDVDWSRLSTPDLKLLRDMPVGRLSLARSYVDDLTPLRGMRLRELDISGTRVRDLSPIDDMRLQRLDLSNTEITNLFPLAAMPLRELIIDFTLVNDFTALRTMPLEVLRASGTPAWNLAPLAQAPLRELDLSRTRVASLRGLEHLPLAELNLTGTSVADLEPLRGSKLTRLLLARTPIKSLAPLQGAPLRELNLAGCAQLESLLPLRECPELERVVLPAQIKEIEHLRKAGGLRFLSYEKSGPNPEYDETAHDFWQRHPVAVQVAPPPPPATARKR
jgi:hypothetical protein